MAAIYEFQNEISCNQAITWSTDNRICLCTDTGIKVFSLHCGVDNTEAKPKFHQTSLPVSPDILDIPQFSVQEHKFLIENLSREELKKLTVDRVLNPWKYQVETVPRTGFAAADWSPLGADSAGRCILAALSQDYRLCLFSNDAEQNVWSLVCDLSAMRHTQTKPDFTLNSIDDFKKYEEWCYTQAISAVNWCPSVFTDPRNHRKYTLLASGTKSGHIVMWKINMPCQNESDCSVLYIVQPNQCQVSGLLWSKNSVWLTAGYVDGQVHKVKLNIKDHTEEPTCSCVYSEPDLMKVSSMCLLEDVKDGVDVLVVNKEQCILALQLDKNNHTVISQNHIFIQNNLPSSGMFALTRNIVLMMSRDSMLQRITVTAQENDLKMESEKVNIDLDTAITWITLGFCSSPNNVLFAFVVSGQIPRYMLLFMLTGREDIWLYLSLSKNKPRPGFDHLNPSLRKTATKLHIKYLDHQNIGSSRQQEYVTKLCWSAGELETLMDVLEFYRQQVLSENMLIDKLDLSGKMSVRKLKLKRYGVMLRYRSVKQREEDETTEEDLKKELDDLLLKIIAEYVKSCLQKLDVETLTKGRDREQSVAVLSAMYSCLCSNADSHGDGEDIAATKHLLEDICRKTLLKCHTECCVCSNKMQLKQFQWLCDNGHSFDICCKTLLPVEGVTYKTCTVCFSHSRPTELLKGFDWLCQDPRICSLCDGLMLP